MHPKAAVMMKYGLARRDEYRSKYKELGWEILSHRYNYRPNPYGPDWMTLRTEVHNSWKWTWGIYPYYNEEL